MGVDAWSLIRARAGVSGLPAIPSAQFAETPRSYPRTPPKQPLSAENAPFLRMKGAFSTETLHFGGLGSAGSTASPSTSGRRVPGAFHHSPLARPPKATAHNADELPDKGKRPVEDRL